MLSDSQATTYIRTRIYNSRVDRFGQFLKALRAERKVGPSVVARRALGETADKNELRNFASYLLRIERGVPKAQNPTLDVVERIATGLGLTLSQFFARIEALKLAVQRSENAASPAGKGTTHAVTDVATSTDEDRRLERFARALGRSIVEESRLDRERKDQPGSSPGPKGRTVSRVRHRHGR